MPNGLPDNFNERWGAMETKMEFMTKKLEKVEPADIQNLKTQVRFIMGVGGTILTGLTIAAGAAWKKLINGGN